MNAEVLATIVAMSLAVQGFVEIFFKPLLLKLKIDTWWLLYIAFPIGFLIGWFSQLNAFTIWFPNVVWLGRIFTALACGAGPSYLYNLMDKKVSVDRLPVANVDDLPKSVAAVVMQIPAEIVTGVTEGTPPEATLTKEGFK